MSWLDKLFPKNKQRIYLDYAAATPVRDEVREVMEKYWSESFYNPSAIYQEGVEVKKEIEEYRKEIAKLVGAGSKEVIFTGSGTESVNLAILGGFEESLKSFKRPHLIISSIEHPAVMRSAEEVVRRGGELTIVPVTEEGVISFPQLKKALKNTTYMVSISLANSEIGTLQPVSKISRLIKEKKKERALFSQYPILHTDASAAVSFASVSLESLGSDLITLDGSKIYGPKGIGILAVRRGITIRPILHGGGQEAGRRAGTLNPALIAGFAKAFELAVEERDRESKRLEALRFSFIEQVLRNCPEGIVNGSVENHLPNIVSISIPGTLSEFIVLKLDKEGVMASVGTACSLDERVGGSPVIAALGKPELREATVRFSFGKFTTEKEIKRAAEIFCLVASDVIK